MAGGREAGGRMRGMARGGKRREPRFDDDDDAPDELRAERRPSPRARRQHDDDDDTDDETPPRRLRTGAMIRGLIYWGATAGVWATVGAGALAVYYGSQLPPIDQLAVPKRPPNIAIMGSDGALLANRGDTGGAAIRIADLPQYLPKAFIAIEDRRFYSHWGVDPQGIGRALLRNVAGRGGIQGGSTLTQQLAKNLFLTQERTISRKIQEAILALWLEHKYSKDQILELYLNRVYFGSGAYGVEAASQHYFGHSAKTATLLESVVLAGLMKAPSKLAPDRNPEGAAERAAQVVTAMAQEGHISEQMAKAALAHPARAMKEERGDSINYAADYVMDMLDDTIGAIDEDIVVTTTIDARLQTVAEGALKEELDKKGAKFGVSQGAVVSLDPNGAIRALVEIGRASCRERVS
jgi:penicillin-binding protein 1A